MLALETGNAQAPGDLRPLRSNRFLLAGGVLGGMVKHLGDEDRDQLTVETMSTEAVTTSEIEGEVLDRLSVQVLE